MKKPFLLLFFFCAVIGIANAQNSYWVFFTDKQNTTFDPYQYFDSKAIERYALCGADLYDVTNYPVNSSYAAQVETACEELVGTSRWLNAAGVMATKEQIAVIRQFPFVAGVQLIASDMEVASVDVTERETDDSPIGQIAIHHGELFRQHNLSGKGVRIAVLDGGFKDADTHPAFQHLRDNHQIIKTWNFVKKNEFVYEAETHGRMVLSCIAGMKGGNTLMGMAPDAQFLLARTEVATEPKKEEVWWVQGLEWADQNGADIVNSSLGYGKQRYVIRNMDGKTSMVAKAANTAARKGMLVCNSMGNEATDKEWRMLITPADADSILSVGAVRDINRIASFSSFGPTADGRMKPNVVAWGQDNVVAGSKGNFTTASGTSFASPMMAGFAACVKQLHPEYTAWQLKTEIEKSANHYPYFDYAFGYGVPQAGYFFGEKPEVTDNLTLYSDKNNVYVTTKADESVVFYKITNGDGSVDKYDRTTLSKGTEDNSNGEALFFSSSILRDGQTLEVWSDGQYIKHTVGQKSLAQADSSVIANSRSAYSLSHIDAPEKDIYKHKILGPYSFSFVLNASFMIPSQWNSGMYFYPDRGESGTSRSLTFAFDNYWKVARMYGLGFRVGFGSSWYAVDRIMVPSEMMPTIETDMVTERNNFKITKFDLELFQRFRLASVGSLWCYLDTGIFGEWNVGRRYKYEGECNNQEISYVLNRELPNYLKTNRFDYGVRLRIGITRAIAIYGQYRISNLLVKKPNQNDLPKWEVGIQFF